KALWYSNKPEFKGMYYNFSDISFVPKPYNGRKIQIWMGGNSNESIDMAIEYCNGWHGVGLTPGRLKLVSGHIEKKLVS
ncbi:MAG: LLM class flavin-dependent oxidoreductase, partial [Candidatus Dadabacteria bacterium]|nr:LLM class flavin-dependent oxidoreductase [Candidatus Dadabacteria bacterium]